MLSTWEKNCIKYLRVILSTLIVLFLLQRVGLIFFGYTHIFHPSFDEPVSGTLAYDLLEGNLRAPLFVYQYENRSGDVLIEGLCLVPFFKLFGYSLFATKCFSLCAAFFSCIFWIILIRKYCGLFAATLFAALFAFPPPMFARLNLVGTLSSHHLINTIVPVQLLLLFTLIDRNKKDSSLLSYLLLGFLAGLGTYCFYSYMIFNVFCFLFFLLCKPSTVSRLQTLVFFAGVLIGFMPWILRSLSSAGGGLYLKAILENVTLDLWYVVQCFGFNVPHSLGYGYPTREIGIVGFLFTLFMLVCIAILLKASRDAYISATTTSKWFCLESLSPAIKLGLFVGLFPVFFITSLSLAPMQINPFEYWPNVGLFALLAPSDLIRYRWLHVLFPFYFGLSVLGIVIPLKVYFPRKIVSYALLIGLAFFLTINLTLSIFLYDMQDLGRVFYYKGYNFDQFAGRFVLSDFAEVDFKKAEEITNGYPAENRGIAYERLAHRLLDEFASDSECQEQLTSYLEQVPSKYLNDFIHGIIRTVRESPDKKCFSFVEIIKKRYPDYFYENWGYRFLGQKYYGALINAKLLLSQIPGPEKWFFADFFQNFRKQIQLENRFQLLQDLLNEIDAEPTLYHPQIVHGLGKLIGAEMLFDPFSGPDYPLDSCFGEKLSPALQDAFYHGVGAGFAETLCRFWRRQMPPRFLASHLHNELAEIEWHRCMSLIEKMPAKWRPQIHRGFTDALLHRQLNQPLEDYVAEKIVQYKYGVESDAIRLN